MIIAVFILGLVVGGFSALWYRARVIRKAQKRMIKEFHDFLDKELESVLNERVYKNGKIGDINNPVPSPYFKQLP
jgi:hypothetical protein